MEEKLMTKEEMVEFLNKLGIETELIDYDKYNFSRDISFKVYDTEYVIEWWINQSYLHIGRHVRAAVIPFKYIYFDTTYPLIDGNRSIGFSDTKLERNSPFDRDYPFGTFRIPIDLTKYNNG